MPNSLTQQNRSVALQPTRRLSDLLTPEQTRAFIGTQSDHARQNNREFSVIMFQLDAATTVRFALRLARLILKTADPADTIGWFNAHTICVLRPSAIEQAGHFVNRILSLTPAGQPLPRISSYSIQDDFKSLQHPASISDDPIMRAGLTRQDLVSYVAQGFAQEIKASDMPTLTKVVPVSDRSDIMEAEKLKMSPRVTWPAKYDVLGVEISATRYEDLVRLLVAAARRGQSALVSFMPVHGVVTAALDPKYRYCINAFDVAAPDGQPVRWALNGLHKVGLPDRVCGPETMLQLCRRAAENGIGIYLYGSTDQTLTLLRANLEDLFPSIRIVGVESPPFRDLSTEENLAAVERINTSGAGFVFIGLGCPRQDVFAYHNRNRIKAVQLCVGAAFDFHAGNKKMAPGWMQRSGLEWVYRLAQEPGRLWKRYLVTNTAFVLLMTRRLITGR